MKKNQSLIQIHYGFRNNYKEFISIESFEQFCLAEQNYWDDFYSKTNITPAEKLRNKYNNLIGIIENNKNSKDSLIKEVLLATEKSPVLDSSHFAVRYLLGMLNEPRAIRVLLALVEPTAVNIFHDDVDTIKLWINVTVMLINNVDNDISLIKDVKESYVASFSNIENHIDMVDKKLTLMINEWTKDMTDKMNDIEIKRAEQESEYRNKYEALEEVYRERIKLLVPVETWESKQRDYSKRGKVWTTWAILDGIIIFIAVYVLSFQFEKYFGKDSYLVFDWVSSLKWLLLSGVGIGVFIYLLRFFIKMALSAYHMSRDAEEKGVLTKFYLSLINDQVIKFSSDENLKNIVITSLFARVETGLLKGDSSPEMPISGVIGEVSRLIK